MGRLCTICRSAKRDEVDAALASGGTFRDISRQTGFSRGSVHRHATGCAREALTAAKDAKTQAAGLSLLARMEALVTKAEGLLQLAEDRARAVDATPKDLGAFGRAIGELRSTLELVGRLTGELKNGPAVEVNVSTGPRTYSADEIRHMALLALDLVGASPPTLDASAPKALALVASGGDSR